MVLAADVIIHTADGVFFVEGRGAGGKTTDGGNA